MYCCTECVPTWGMHVLHQVRRALVYCTRVHIHKRIIFIRKSTNIFTVDRAIVWFPHIIWPTLIYIYMYLDPRRGAKRLQFIKNIQFKWSLWIIYVLIYQALFGVNRSFTSTRQRDYFGREFHTGRLLYAYGVEIYHSDYTHTAYYAIQSNLQFVYRVSWDLV
jgi:hypothetical protein